MTPLIRLRLQIFAATLPPLLAAFWISVHTNRLLHLAWGFALAALATWLLNRRFTRLSTGRSIGLSTQSESKESQP